MRGVLHRGNVLFCLFLLISDLAYAPPGSNQKQTYSSQFRPALEASLRANVEPVQAEALLSVLSEMDYASFEDEIPSLSKYARNLPLDSKEQYSLARRYLNRTRSLLGELYAAKVARSELVPKWESSRFLTPFEYNQFNFDGTRPDGIVYSQSGDSVVIKAVLESKMGNAVFSQAQAMGYIRVWQTLGLAVSSTQRYKPEKILVQNEGQLVPLSSFQVGSSDLVRLIEAKTHLFGEGDNKSKFLGTYHALPLSPNQFSLTAISFMAHLWSTRFDPDEVWRTRIQKVQAGLSPVSDLSLYEWISVNGRFPKGGSKDPFEKALAGYVADAGHQAKVFAELLSEKERRLLEANNQGPAVTGTEKWLVQVNALDPDAGQVLGYYLRLVGKERGKLFLKKLAATPIWKTVVTKYPYATLESGQIPKEGLRRVNFSGLVDYACPWLFGYFKD